MKHTRQKNYSRQQKKTTHRNKRPARKIDKRARPLHRRIALHPISVLFLLCVGVLLITITINVAASSYTITGEVPAPPLTEPAIITYPQNGAILHNQSITVLGTCPYQSYVNLSDNDIFAGSSFCDSSGGFTIPISLDVGTNMLQAQDYNITNSPGPVSPGVQVVYAPLLPLASGLPPPSTPKASPHANSGATPYANTYTSPYVPLHTPLHIIIHYMYTVFQVGKPGSFSVSIAGGITPYALTVNWGDGSTSTYLRKNSDYFPITHTYSWFAAKQVDRTIGLQAVDAVGDTSAVQFQVVVKNPNYTISHTICASLGGQCPSILSTIRNWLWLIWPAYGIVLLMVFCFWLGERQEYRNLMARQVLKMRVLRR